MTGKGRQDGSHVQGTLAGHNLFLKRFLMLEPGIRKIALPGVEVGHAVPGQMCRSGEIVPDLLFIEPQTGPHLEPYRLLTGDGQRHVDAVERHPVDEMLPFLPLPPGHGIAKGAIVQEETLRSACFNAYLPGDGRKGIRQFGRVVGKPGHGCLAEIFQIMVESYGHGIG